jgi:hypothetical protein
MNIKKNIYIVADLRERKIAKFWRLYIYIYIYIWLEMSWVTKTA